MPFFVYAESRPHWLCRMFNLQETYRIPIQKQNSWSYNFVEVSGHNPVSSQTWGFHIKCLHNKPVFQTTFTLWGGGGVKSVILGDCEWQGGKLLGLLSQLRPRIRPQIQLVCLFILLSCLGSQYNLPLHSPYFNSLLCHKFCHICVYLTLICI